ncbi:Putative phosphatidylglycerol/phosphatidylinositol transfer protein DDB_G0282107, partial [Geodia barretti]
RRRLAGSSGDSVKILSLNVTPDPPEKGQKVTADVKLEFTEEVEGGSLNILVKYKYIPVMNKKKDLCNIPDILADSCPLQPGVHEATFIQKFPSHAPYGTYVGKVVAKDKSGNELVCIKLNFTI